MKDLTKSRVKEVAWKQLGHAQKSLGTYQTTPHNQMRSNNARTVECEKSGLRNLAKLHEAGRRKATPGGHPKSSREESEARFGLRSWRGALPEVARDHQKDTLLGNSGNVART